MPCYSFLLCSGFYHSSKKQFYIIRLFGIFAVSQIPFYYLFGTNRLNICFVWLISALWLLIYDKNRGVGYFCLAPALVLLLAVPCDYGVIAFGWVLLFRFGMSWSSELSSELGSDVAYNKKALIKGFLMFSAALLLSFYDKVQIFALFALPVIYYFSKKDKVYIKDNTLKVVYRYFYPCHMVLLKGVSLCLL